ncbi:DUF1697 domain-containing protein [Plantactinospora sp. GCM10030261]|uniref:DUF1697 domain-containing protein n=1 Tax=Plantactinospora sp. GCM10030261 TaxID=3273420 RepID=UPI00361D3613
MTTTRYAALLRGINLGKARRVGMADLRAALTEGGYQNVATLLQSGNVVLDADEPTDKLARSIERIIEKRFGFAVDTIVRSRADLARIAALNPLGGVATDGAKYVVVFLAEPAAAPVEAVLTDIDLGDDRYVVDGAEVYAWCPHGQRDSPVLTALGKVKGGPSATVRNWNTVEKLLAMMD